MIDVKGLQKNYGGLQVLKGVDLTINKGDCVVLVGPSGCGKSTFLRCLNRLEEPDGGHVIFNGKEVTDHDIDHVRQKMGMVFQHFNLFPHLTVKKNITLAPVRLGLMKQPEADKKAMELLERIGLADKADVYPNMLSGGMSQRVMIAMAIACRPKLLIADEPTTALDVTIQAQSIELLLELQQKENMALVLITHDLALVAEAAHKIIVMYAGQVVETGDAHAIFHAPRHPYTQALLRALPEFAQDKESLASLPGVVPGKYDRPNGCLLNPRCPYATDRCRAEEPALNMLADGRQSKCHYPLDDAGRPTL